MNKIVSNLKQEVDDGSATICILGMHRSGTSTIARAINLLEIYLGESAKIALRSPGNPEGFWEHHDIFELQNRLLGQLKRTWDTAMPLPEMWHRSSGVQPFKEELAQLIAFNFSGHPIWAWKDPRTCLLLPLWRDVLNEMGTKLSCLFILRNPVDVANSVIQENPFSFNQAVGTWFHYNIAALTNAAGLPIVFVSYEHLLANWEPELRRCATSLGIAWPADELQLQEAMNSFIQPGLRHQRSSLSQLQKLPDPVQELYQLLLEAAGPAVCDNHFEERVNRLSADFHAYASFFENGHRLPPPSWRTRTWRRWKNSFRKRFLKPVEQRVSDS